MKRGTVYELRISLEAKLFHQEQHSGASLYYISFQYNLQHTEPAKIRQPTDLYIYHTSGCDKYILINTCIPQFLYSSLA